MVGSGRVPRGTQNAQQFLENLVIMDTLPGAQNPVNITRNPNFVARHKKVVMKVVHLALHFLRTENGRDGLQNVLHRLITDWNHFEMGHIFPHNEDHTDANTRLQSGRAFLNSLSIRSALVTADAAVNPRTSREQRNKALTNWAHHIFIMSIALAHEYIHIFVGMFTGGTQPRTPVTVRWEPTEMEVDPREALDFEEEEWMDNPDMERIPTGVPRKVAGESGFVWEGYVIGGKIVCYYHPSIHLENKARHETSGLPYFV